jgi:tripartite-type tricarboxylate transporter receptor subunit TctC
MNFARRLQLAAAVILVALSGGAAWSQATRTITVIVPYQPGGGTDVLARVLAEQIIP